MDILKIIGRDQGLFDEDMSLMEVELSDIIKNSSFLVVGGAGSIGLSVVLELMKRNPKRLHVIDISENNLVEVVRRVRSSVGYSDGEFNVFAIDSNSEEFDALMNNTEAYDYVLNLSALKHVRSESDPYTLMRMICVNVINTMKLVDFAKSTNAKKFFCVSTDKASNPVNMMGASKRIMEKMAFSESENIGISMARFANVAFSDGSLLHGFNQRILLRQPITAPKDIRRYFISPQEAGELCVSSTLFGNSRDIFFPKLSEKVKLISFVDILFRYLEEIGKEPIICENEDEARSISSSNNSKNKWPVYLFESDTTGEKLFEEFFMSHEIVDLQRFRDIGVVKTICEPLGMDPKSFEESLQNLKHRNHWDKGDLLELFYEVLPEFNHHDTGKSLNERM